MSGRRQVYGVVIWLWLYLYVDNYCFLNYIFGFFRIMYYVCKSWFLDMGEVYIG